jgi:hypothetical protein
MGRGKRAQRRPLSAAARTALAALTIALGGCGSGGSHAGSARAQANAGSGQTISPGTGTSTNITTQPLPTPAAADVIGAADSASLFRQRNFARALSNLTALLGPKSSITNMAVYPGEIDLVVDQPDGDARRIRVDHAGAVSEGKPVPLNSGPVSIYLNQIDRGIAQLLTADVASSEGVPVGRVLKMVLVTGLPGKNAGWDVSVLPRRGTEPVTYRALLSGAGLRRR